MAYDILMPKFSGLVAQGTSTAALIAMSYALRHIPALLRIGKKRWIMLISG